MLTYTDAILRMTLTRLAVDEECLSKLIQVTATLYRKTQSTDSVPGNAIIAVVLELLSDGLRMKVRVLPITLKAMLEVCDCCLFATFMNPELLTGCNDDGDRWAYDPRCFISSTICDYSR